MIVFSALPPNSRYAPARQSCVETDGEKTLKVLIESFSWKIVIDDIQRSCAMDILGKVCTLWLLVILNSGLLMAQFSTDLLYKEVNLTS